MSVTIISSPKTISWKNCQSFQQSPSWGKVAAVALEILGNLGIWIENFVARVVSWYRSFNQEPQTLSLKEMPFFEPVARDADPIPVITQTIDCIHPIPLPSTPSAFNAQEASIFQNEGNLGHDHPDIDDLIEETKALCLKQVQEGLTQTASFF